MNKLKVIDVFSGVGGLSLGAARAGFTISLAVELDRHAVSAHKKNFPHVKHIAEDVSTINGSTLLQLANLKLGELDGLIGGPPCQGFSTIGHRHITDPRNNLFRKFFTLVSESRPRFFLAENVLGILNAQYGNIRSNALDLIRNEYMLLDPIRFKANDFGAATSRERVFFIGWRKDLAVKFERSDFDQFKVKSYTTVKAALHGLPSRINSNWQTEAQGWRRLTGALPNSDFAERIINGIPQDVGDPESMRRYYQDYLVSGCLGTRHSPKVTARYDNLKAGQQDKVSKSVRLDLNGLCPTLRAGTGADKGSYQAVRPIHPTIARVITPREAARLQGFPDWFQFSPTKWHSFRQIGNSVSPLVAESILSVIYSKII